MTDGQNRYLAVDLGASGGTVYSGLVSPDELSVTEVTRFDNGPVRDGDRYVWDVDRLRDEIVAGIVECTSRLGPVDSVGIDTWGTDFGFVADGELLRAPYSYRDPSLTATREELFETVGKRAIFDRTGISHWDAATTLYHYHSIVRTEPEVVAEADRLLMMPQLLSWLLGGDESCEATIASTTQMVDPTTREWATDLLAAADLPTDVLPPVEPAGRVIGTVDSDHLPSGVEPPEIVLPASHDTAAAVAALPLDRNDRLFVSTGTWFIAGLELDSPDRSQDAFDVGASNELGVDGSTRFLKNVNGFFLLEECRESWNAAGRATDYEAILRRIDDTEPFGPLVDPDDEAFGIEGEMPEKIREYCRRTGQTPPESVGETARCILESLAVKTAVVLERLAAVTGDASERIHLGGGGVRNARFCQMLADAAGMPVVAGPVEATSVGNLISQAVARGDVPSIEAGRALVESSVELTTYAPEADGRWADAKDRMRRLIDDN